VAAQAALGIPARTVTFYVFEGRQHVDDWTLYQAYVTAGSTVYIIPRISQPKS
jgi:hypothetical protein